MTENKEFTPREFFEIIDKTNIENPKDDDVKALRKALRTNPQLWKLTGNMADNAVQNMISKVNSTPALKESLKVAWKEMQKELLGDTPNPLEELLVQQVVMSWLRLQLVDYHFTEMMNKDITLTMGKYWEGRL